MSVTKYNLKRYANGAHVGNNSFGIFHLVTDDAVSVVETNGYLDALAEKFCEGTGDIIHAVMDADGTPAGKSYLVTRTAGDVALTPFVDATT